MNVESIANKLILTMERVIRIPLYAVQTNVWTAQVYSYKTFIIQSNKYLNVSNLFWLLQWFYRLSNGDKRRRPIISSAGVVNTYTKFEGENNENNNNNNHNIENDAGDIRPSRVDRRLNLCFSNNYHRHHQNKGTIM